jgi:hypothetical protein
MKLAAFDFYPKTLQEFRQRTLTGAAVSVSCTVLIAVLTVIEVADYSEVKQDGHLFVDTSRGQQLRINMNITFPALPCSGARAAALHIASPVQLLAYCHCAGFPGCTGSPEPRHARRLGQPCGKRHAEYQQGATRRRGPPDGR